MEGRLISRRGFLAASGGLPSTLFFSACVAGARWLQLLKSAPWGVFRPDGTELPGVALTREWRGAECELRLQNKSGRPVRLGEAQVFRFAHGLPGDTPIYVEGYQMLSQTAGTIAHPEQIGGYTDARHYRLPSPKGAFTGYNLLRFEAPQADSPLMAFTSCRRFSGKFHLWPERLEIALDLDGVELGAGEALDLESFAVFHGERAQDAYGALAETLRRHHPPIAGPKPPQGWCSWYCFGPEVTAAQVMSNLDFIEREMSNLRYIQIDDGYQAAMGDWLETGSAFGGDVRAVLREIKRRGFEPALWVAPFIAEEASKVFQQHPDWFMQDEDGRPLPSNRVTFGGWRHGPWYALDGSHPGARQHLESVFRTMHEEWGVSYLKLDGNFWGTMPVGRLHDRKATRVEAYRRGMEAIRRGAGDAFLLGCNHPLWPSLGLIHGSRSSNDISLEWPRVKRVARENFHRGWQNGRLWWNDPDVVRLSGSLSDDEFHFHAASILASGGMLLAGDDLPALPPERLGLLRKLSPPAGQAAVFDEVFLRGWLRKGDQDLLFLLNWADTVELLTLEVREAAKITDYWTEEPVSLYGGNLVLELQPHSARVLVLHPAAA